MKLNECCIPRCISCSNCELYALMVNNRQSKNDIKLNNNCKQAVITYAQYLYDELSVNPSGIKDLNTVKLIELIGMRLPKENISLLLNLCSVAMDSIISRGLRDSVDRTRAYRLLGLYSNILKMFETYEANDELCIDSYTAYLNAKFQVLHLTKDYIDVIKEYQLKKEIFSLESPLQRELAVHFSASSYLTQDRKHKITSREVAEQIYEIVKDRYVKEQKIAANDYYCLAKYLEHYIQEDKIRMGIDKITPFLNAIERDEIESSREALNKVIFHRDMYEALGKVESGECEYHYTIAQQIINDYGILDQQSKLLDKRKEVETYRLRGYHPVPSVIQKIYVVDKGIVNNNYDIQNNWVIQTQEVEKTYYSEEDAKMILKEIVETQDEKYEALINMLMDELIKSNNELKRIAESIRENNKNTESKGIFNKLKDFMNDSMETGENIEKIYVFFSRLIPKAIEQWPEIQGDLMEIIEKYSVR